LIIFCREIFFSFRHLPASLVASFAKRLARLALLIPQHDQCLILTFINNLILRHPTIRILIDRPEVQSSMKDSYSSEELDPNKTNAIESSLWEIEVNNHFNKFN
jgi:U3 small nucleolar RNA-associated protein 19